MTKSEIYKRNVKLTGVEQKGEKRICIKFADGGSITASQQSWWFCWKLTQRCRKKYGGDVRKWPKYLWVDKK